MGMYLMRQIGTRGVYGNAELPDFMVFLNWNELPWPWWGFNHFGFAMIMALAVPALLAAAFGWLAFRSRVTGVYLSIITQAMTYALMLAFFRNDMGFGGNNGLTDFKDLLGFEIQAPGTRLALYAASAVALGGGFLLCRFIVTSKLGRILLALRDAEARVRFLGYSTANAKLFVFVLSAMLCGLAGALYVPQVGIINPGEFAPGNSIEIAIWVAVGGRGTLTGAVLGALVVNIAKTMADRCRARTLAVRAGRAVHRGHAAAAGRDPRPRNPAEADAGPAPGAGPERQRCLAPPCSISTASPSASTASRH